MSERTLRRRAAVIRQLIATGGRPRVGMSGTSMRPLLGRDMTLELGPRDAAAFGDILLFEGPGALVAHRVIARTADGWVTAGDAVRHVERVSPSAAVARVERVLREDGRRVDGRTWRIVGRGIAAQRAARYHVRSALRRALAPAGAWPALLQLLRAAVCDDREGFVRALRSVDEAVLFALARRHRCAGIVAAAARRWQVGARGSAFARARMQTALHAGAYERDVVAVVRALTAAGCEIALLKGAARSYAREPGYELHRSFDIDVLVAPDDLDAATAALATLGYAPFAGTVEPGHHHVAPLVAPGRPPVELHLALAPAWRFSIPLDARAMLRRTRLVDGPAGPVAVLDDAARLIHLCVHAADLRPMRDLAIAAATWRALGPGARQAVVAELSAETRERVRLMTALAYVRALAGDTSVAPPEVRRYAAWAASRERLPEALRDRCAVLDAWYARAAARTAFNGLGLPRRVGRVTVALLAATFARLAHEPMLGERGEDAAHVGLDVA